MSENPIWKPSGTRIAKTRLSAFIDLVDRTWGISCKDYQDLHQWSIDEPEKFWKSLWDFGGVISETTGNIVIRDAQKLPGAVFFPDAKLNFAENLLRRRDHKPAIIFSSETCIKRNFSYKELYELVSRLRQAMIKTGVKPGDRVAALLPNIPEAVACMLAATSLGAIWSSCSPDFGIEGILDRFRQIKPKLLIGVDRYFYNGHEFDCCQKTSKISSELGSVKKTIIIPFDPENNIYHKSNLAEYLKPFKPEPITFESFSFNHPLYVLFSSGTTGIPKCIIHGAGGTLIQHIKEHMLQTDTQPGDRIFYFTTLGWMMWNWLVSALAMEATLVLYDGAPFYPNANALFDYADKAKVTHFGTSAKFIDALKKTRLSPKSTHDLSSVQTILSTGSPLLPESFDYIYKQIKSDVCVSSISGGTDIVGCFAAGNPNGPVFRGELQAKCLGMDVAIFSPEGRPLIGHKGELVCRNSFPSMPLGFWNDQTGNRFKSAYFERFPGVWHHGDWAELTERGGLIIYGRSDATLNPGGVRIGTAEIYRQVEQLSEVEEAIAVGQEAPDGDVRIVLFVRLRVNITLDQELQEKIRYCIREGASPRHTPSVILEVSDIPRTKSGKITELAVRDVIHGRVVENVESLANPEALDQFRDRKELLFTKR
ncbi:MAG: acetoacetate--CoA ligase [Pseudomonadota bacterium]|nr:acetoacetate--CoA ligase [Pseudomonadota bacterium]